MVTARTDFMHAMAYYFRQIKFDKSLLHWSIVPFFSISTMSFDNIVSQVIYYLLA